MNRIFTLASALRKNNRSMAAVTKDESENNNTLSFAALTNYIIPIAVALLSGAAGYFLTLKAFSALLSQQAIVLFLGIIITVMVLVLSFVKIINSMYLSDDLPVLMALPFKEGQIAFAKVMIIAEQQYLYSACILIPFTTVYSIMSEFNPLFCIASIVMLITFPAITMSIVGVVVMLILRFVNFIRNKNLIRIIGAVVGVSVFASLYYVFLANNTSNENIALKILVSLSGMTETLSKYFPLSDWMSDFAACGNVLPLLYIVLVLLCSLALFFLAAKLLYFKAALGMQSASSSGKKLSLAEMKSKNKKKSVVRSLVIRDIKLIVREPSMLFRTLLMPFAISLIITIILAGSMVTSMGEYLHGRTMAPLFAFSFALFLAYFAFGGINCGITAISREGKSYSVTNSLPISYSDLLKAKRNVAFAFAIVFTTIPVTITLTIMALMGIIPLYAVLYVPVISISAVFIMSECQVLTDIKNPNFIWENPNDIRKSNFSLLAFMLADYAYLAIVISITIFIRMFFDFPYAGYIVCGIFSIVSIIIAYFVNKHYFKQGQKYLKSI